VMGRFVQMFVQLPVEHRLQCYSGALTERSDRHGTLGNIRQNK
jgi:hypothetical protein